MLPGVPQHQSPPFTGISHSSGAATFPNDGLMMTAHFPPGSGVTVVNIDNGFGAAYAAAQINRLLTAPHHAVAPELFQRAASPLND